MTTSLYCITFDLLLITMAAFDRVIYFPEFFVGNQ